MDSRPEELSVRGLLSALFFPVLIGNERERLFARLGPRARVAIPGQEAAAGAEAIARLNGLGNWLTEVEAQFQPGPTVSGRDRDVTVGELWYGPPGERKVMATAVSVLRRPEREVSVRLYAPAVAPGGPSPLVVADETTVVDRAGILGRLADGLVTGDEAAVLGCFEASATLTLTADGQRIHRTDKAFGTTLHKFGVGGVIVGLAEEGGFSSLEVRTSSGHGQLLWLERGGSSLFAHAAIYR